jgi:hypothetical protein
MAKSPLTIAERFWSYVSAPDENGCRHWRAARHHARNYGLFKVRKGVQVTAHSFAWRLTYQGPVHPDAAVFRHSCDVHYPTGSTAYRPCCEPSHVWPGTTADNMADKMERGREARGERCGSAKLSDAAVDAMRAALAAGRRQIDIAADFGVTQGYVSKVKRGATRSGRHARASCP